MGGTRRLEPRAEAAAGAHPQHHPISAALHPPALRVCCALHPRCARCAACPAAGPRRSSLDEKEKERRGGKAAQWDRKQEVGWLAGWLWRRGREGGRPDLSAAAHSSQGSHSELLLHSVAQLPPSLSLHLSRWWLTAQGSIQQLNICPPKLI